MHLQLDLRTTNENNVKSDLGKAFTYFLIDCFLTFSNRLSDESTQLINQIIIFCIALFKH